jgi:hypothetical protein
MKRYWVGYFLSSMALLAAAFTLHPAPLHLSLVVAQADDISGRENQEMTIKMLTGAMNPEDSVIQVCTGNSLFGEQTKKADGFSPIEYLVAPDLPTAIASTTREIRGDGEHNMLVVLGGTAKLPIPASAFLSLPSGSHIRLIDVNLSEPLIAFHTAAPWNFDLRSASATQFAPAAKELAGELEQMHGLYPTRITWLLLSSSLLAVISSILYRWRRRQSDLRIMWEKPSGDLQIASLQHGEQMEIAGHCLRRDEEQVLLCSLSICDLSKARRLIRGEEMEIIGEEEGTLYRLYIV